jgi:3-isopropylmalate/(R)-2-methylmalate dehydratase small subunit
MCGSYREAVMQPFTVLTAVAAPLEIASVDTGMILPGRYMRRHRRPGHDYGEAFLYDLRFDEAGRPRADFVLNDPAYRDAKILVTGRDFGCGSSREGAAFAVMDFGLRALVGPSFGEIFQVNCIQNGILAMTLPETIIQDLWRQLRARPGAEMTIDLPNQSLISKACVLRSGAISDWFGKSIVISAPGRSRSCRHRSWTTVSGSVMARMPFWTQLI